MPVNTPGGGLVRGAAVGAGAKSDDPGGNLLFVGALHILTCLVCGGPKASRQRAAPRASTRGGAGVRGLTWHEGFKGAVLVGGGVAVLCACRCLSGAYADMCPCFQHIWGKPICMGVVAVHRWRARTACDDCCASAGCTGACPQDCKAGRPAADRVLPASVMNPRGRRGVGLGGGAKRWASNARCRPGGRRGMLGGRGRRGVGVGWHSKARGGGAAGGQAAAALR